jgi:hypothetical protein
MTRDAGFSLIEATMAAAILLATCLSASAILITTLRAGRLVDTRVALDEALASERARLAVLPYYAPAPRPIEGAAWDPDGPSLLAQVFPHALAGFNMSVAFYRAVDGSAAFVTQRTLGGVTIYCEARFVRWTGVEWTALPEAAVAGWALWHSGALPAAMIEVHLTATAGRHSSSLRMRLGALPPAVEKTAAGMRSRHAA